MEDLAEGIQYATKQQYGDGTIPEQCLPYFQHYYSHLNYYEPEPFVINMDYKNLEIIVEVFRGFVRVVFKVDKLFEFFEQIYLYFKDGMKVDMGLASILNAQIGFMVMLVVLLVLLVLSVLSTVLSVLIKVKGSRPPTQEISVSKGAGRLGYAGLMVLLVLLIFLCSLVGLVGNMHFKRSKTTYVHFAANASEHLIAYLTNITTDMRTISDEEFKYMTDNIETDFYKYQMNAAVSVKQLEQPHAMVLKTTAAKAEQLEKDIIDTIVKSLDILRDIYDLASPANDTLTACHAGVNYFCTTSPNFCNDVFNAGNVEPITRLDTATWPFRVTMETVLSYTIPDTTYENWKLWDSTTEDLMNFNEPVRVEQQQHHHQIRAWLKNSFRKAGLLLTEDWIKKIGDASPAQDIAYGSSSGFSSLLQILDWVMVVTFSLTFFTSIACMGLYALGLCVSDPDTRPTDRSAMSDTIATAMKVASGLTALQLIVVLGLTVPFFVVTSVVMGSCQATNGSQGQNPFWLWDNGTITPTPSLISRAIGNTASSEIKFWDLVKGCEENHSLYNLLHLEKSLATGELFEVREFLGIKRYCDNSGLNPHDHWYSTFYTPSQKANLDSAITETDVTVADDAGRILPYLDDLTVTERKLVRLPESDYQQFENKVNQAIGSLNTWHAQRANLVKCRDVIQNLELDVREGDSWKTATQTIDQKFAKYRSKVTQDDVITLIQKYHGTLKTLESENTPMFKWSESKYKIMMKEANVELDQHVECHRDIARHQTEGILGRCRPLYDLYLASFNLVCGTVAPSGSLVTLSLLGLSLAMTCFMFNLGAVIPYFQRMERLHESDVKKLELAGVAAVGGVGAVDNDV